MEKNYTILGNVEVTEEMFDWFNLLAKGNEDRINQFALLNDESPTAPSTIIRYRRKLLEQQPKNLRIEEGTLEELAEQLQEMFLEPIWEGYVKTIKKVMQKNNWTWKDVVREHYEDMEKRIWRIISCKNKYIA